MGIALGNPVLELIRFGSRDSWPLAAPSDNREWALVACGGCSCRCFCWKPHRNHEPNGRGDHSCSFVVVVGFVVVVVVLVVAAAAARNANLVGRSFVGKTLRGEQRRSFRNP